MKYNLIILALFVLLSTSTCNHNNQRYVYYDQRTNSAAWALKEISMDIEQYYHTNGKYPLMDTPQFNKSFSASLSLFPCFQNAYRYKGNDYELLFISKVCDDRLCCVMKLNRNGIYWKDYFVEPTMSIDDIDWSSINHLAIQIYRDKKGNLDFSHLNLPWRRK
jgi:hypothetical protein